MSKALHRTLQAKMAALQGPEWDSSDEEGAAAAKPTMSKDKKSKKKLSKQDKTRPTKDSTKTTMAKRQTKDDDSDDEEEDLVLYIGHLPKEFEEKDLIKFLSQFGKVYNCRIARKIQTGNAKGYAFARFGDSEVAKIVCDTLHGYFLGRQRLVCQLRPSHPGMFFNTDSVIAKRRLQKRLEKKQRSQNLANVDKLKQITSKLVSREQKKRKQLKAMGIDYDFPGYATNQAEYQVQFADDDEDDEVQTSTRKRSDSAGSEGSAKKKKKKNSVDSEGSAKKKKKRKDSVGSVDDEVDQKRERAASVESEGSSKKSKRKESIDSQSSEKKKHKKRRKDSVDSEGSVKKKRKNSDASNLSVGETPEKSKTRQAETAVKKAKKKKDKKRRESAP